jgi:YHS domain-containing protein
MDSRAPSAYHRIMRMLAFAAALVVLAAGAARAGDAAAPAAAPHTGPVEDRSRICMMQDSLQPKPGLAHEYGGKTYWLCCPMCVQAFTADPERYARATDPVNGAMVDKATAPVYAVNGKAFFFSSDETRRRFAKEPARFLAQGG